jgi:hypothetical protein
VSSISWTQARARVAGLSRENAPDSTVVVEAKRDLRAARLEDYVARTVAQAPPLTPEQRDRIASLLRTGGVKR